MTYLANREGDDIVIRVPVAALPDAALVAFDEAWGFEQHTVKVVDADAFAKELIHQLNKEAENGDTAIHTMLDKACVWAAEDGAEGLSE